MAGDIGNQTAVIIIDNHSYSYMRFITYFLILVALAGFTIEASAKVYAINTFPSEITPDVGDIKGIDQDSRGLLWVWGSNGAFSYDGSRFKLYTKENGLQDNYCYIVTEGPDGFLYFGTYRGISILDPRSGNITSHTINAGSPNRDIVFTKDAMFLATDYGVLCVRGNGGYLIPLPNLEDNCYYDTMVHDLLIDSTRNELWVATDRAGMFKINLEDVDTFTRFKSSQLQVEYEKRGNVFLEEKGTFIHDPTLYMMDSLKDRQFFIMDRVKQYTFDSPTDFWEITRLFQNPEGEVFGYTGLVMYKVAENSLLSVQDNFQMGGILPTSVEMNRKGEWLLVSPTETLLMQEADTLSFNEYNGLPSLQIDAMLLDRQGIYWFADEYGIISHMVTSEFHIYREDQYKFLQNLKAIIPVNETQNYLIAANGMGLFETGSIRELKFENYPVDVQQASLDNHGNIILLTAGAIHLIRKDSKTVETLAEGGNRGSEYVQLSRAADGNLKMYMGGSIYTWDGKKLEVIEDLFGEMFFPIYLYAGAGETFYIGTWNGMFGYNGSDMYWYFVDRMLEILIDNPYDHPVVKRRRQEYKKLPDDALLNIPVVNSGGMGADGNYWFGTFSSGIIKVANDSIEVFDTRNGLPSNRFSSHYLDQEGNLYFIADKSVVKVSQDTIQEVKLNIPPDVRLRWIATDDQGIRYIATSKGVILSNDSLSIFIDRGLGLDESTVNKVVRTADGDIIAMQPNGFFSLEVSDLLKARGHFNPILTEIWGDSIPLSISEKIMVPKGVRSIHLKFSLPDYFNSQRNQFSWRLHGLDKDFSPFREDVNEAIYPRLPPGEYSFQLKAINGIGDKSELAQVVHIIVPPYFHETNLFKIIVVLIFLAVGPIIYRVRTARIIAYSHELEAKVQERTSELSEALRKLEDSRKREIEAEKLRAAQSMATAIAHEFNNPLAIISGIYQLYEKKFRELGDEKMMERLNKIPATISRMHDLVQKLLRITTYRESDYPGGSKIFDVHAAADSESEEDLTTKLDRNISQSKGQVVTSQEEFAKQLAALKKNREEK
ncbi:hypothetical protein K8I28_13070 [bacterium]|nr:hypothetical protein [bacterium]